VGKEGDTAHLIREFRTHAVYGNGMSLISCIYALHRVTVLSDLCLGAMSACVWRLASSDVNTYSTFIKESQIVSAVRPLHGHYTTSELQVVGKGQSRSWRSYHALIHALTHMMD